MVKNDFDVKMCECGCEELFPNTEAYFYRSTTPNYQLGRTTKACYKRKKKERRDAGLTKDRKLCDFYPDYIYC